MGKKIADKYVWASSQKRFSDLKVSYQQRNAGKNNKKANAKTVLFKKNRQRLKKSAQLELPSNSTELTLWGSRSPPGAPPACWSRDRALWAAWAPWWRPGDAGWTTWQGPTRSCSPPCTWRTPWEGPAKGKWGKVFLGNGQHKFT